MTRSERDWRASATHPLVDRVDARPQPKRPSARRMFWVRIRNTIRNIFR